MELEDIAEFYKKIFDKKTRKKLCIIIYRIQSNFIIFILQYSLFRKNPPHKIRVTFSRVHTQKTEKKVTNTIGECEVKRK